MVKYFVNFERLCQVLFDKLLFNQYFNKCWLIKSTMKKFDHDIIQAGEHDNVNNALKYSIVPVHIPTGGG